MKKNHNKIEFWFSQLQLRISNKSFQQQWEPVATCTTSIRLNYDIQLSSQIFLRMEMLYIKKIYNLETNCCHPYIVYMT